MKNKTVDNTFFYSSLQVRGTLQTYLRELLDSLRWLWRHAGRLEKGHRETSPDFAVRVCAVLNTVLNLERGSGNGE